MYGGATTDKSGHYALFIPAGDCWISIETPQGHGIAARYADKVRVVHAAEGETIERNYDLSLLWSEASASPETFAAGMKQIISAAREEMPFSSLIMSPLINKGFIPVVSLAGADRCIILPLGPGTEHGKDVLVAAYACKAEYLSRQKALADFSILTSLVSRSTGWEVEFIDHDKARYKGTGPAAFDKLTVGLENTELELVYMAHGLASLHFPKQ